MRIGSDGHPLARGLPWRTIQPGLQLVNPLLAKTFIDRAELNRAIESFGARSDANTARIEAVVVALGVKVDHLAERVIKVEST